MFLRKVDVTRQHYWRTKNMPDKDYEDGFIDCFEWITQVIEDKYKIKIDRNDLLEELKHPKK